MMKKYSIFLVVLILVICSGCTNREIETEEVKTGEKSDVNAYDTRTEEVNKLTEVVYDKLGEVLNLSKEALAEKLNAGIVENAKVIMKNNALKTAIQYFS